MSETEIVRFGPFTFDRYGALLQRDGERIAVSPRVLQVLECLLERPGKLVPNRS